MTGQAISQRHQDGFAQRVLLVYREQPTCNWATTLALREVTFSTPDLRPRDPNSRFLHVGVGYEDLFYLPLDMRNGGLVRRGCSA